MQDHRVDTPDIFECGGTGPVRFGVRRRGPQHEFEIRHGLIGRRFDIALNAERNVRTRAGSEQIRLHERKRNTIVAQ
jgi:hypothetical protein